MKFKKILIVTSEKITPKHLEAVEKVKKTIEQADYSVVKSRDLQESCFKDINLVITIGGDGAFIRAARFLDNKIPILGINSEPEFSEGFLTSLKDYELEALKEILNGNYKIIERQRAKVKRDNLLIKELVLSEVFIGAEKQFQTSRYILILGNKHEEQRSSGVIVATGTGSTSWYKSAGGKPFDFSEKKLGFIVREPYTGNRVFKPSMLNGEVKEKISFESTRYGGSIISIDGNTTYEFENGDKIEIEISDCPLKILEKR